MGMLVNIDNGGTLTDICVLKDKNVYKTKTLTTPYDLSKCFFDGLKSISTCDLWRRRCRKTSDGS